MFTAHFGQWVAGVGRRPQQWQVAAGLIYGQVKKIYRRRRLVGVRQVLQSGTREALQVALQGLGLSGKLNTSLVERVNLTLRRSVAALIRERHHDSTKQETVALLQQHAAATLEYIHGLSEAQLCRTVPIPLLAPWFGDAVSAQQLIEGLLPGHIQMHLASMKAATGIA